MIFSDNLTNKELLLNAMPLVSLSRVQWNTLIKHALEVEKKEGTDSDIIKILEILTVNQSRIEVTNNYVDSYLRDIDKPVSEESKCVFQLI